MKLLHQQAATSILYLTIGAQTVYASGLYAYYTERCIQVIAQDSNTGNILYSNCNSLDTPVFPIDKSNVLSTTSKPRNGTALAAAGWWNNENISASISFQNEDGAITNAFYECDMKTGHLVFKGKSSISSIARVDSVHEETGLSVELIGINPNAGCYRLFCHDAERHVMSISYTDARKWFDSGVVSQDPSRVFARGSSDIEIARRVEDDPWQLETFPRPLRGNSTNETKSDDIEHNKTAVPEFSLPSWRHDTQTIGISVRKDAAPIRLCIKLSSQSGDLGVVSTLQGSEVWIYY
ncbi:hypothetical protein B0T10DRAFT_558150 [Thelonectria olida]|uniref:Fucose-specific lectin n=1 Tax=Thelonectria olida TaxID=1576542 RepID=A0A9P8WCG3_9HYPO|nr:hypothetical protein B0T10DRAFT_558150 [Thelonectria olida]